MKNKKIVAFTLVTLLAPTFLNAQLAVADSLQEPMTAESATPAVEEATSLPVVETPSVQEPTAEQSVPETPVVEAPAESPVIEAPIEVPYEESVLPEVLATAETADSVVPLDITQLPPAMGDADAPVISVTPVKTIRKGQAFNPLEGVTAYDSLDGNITSSIVVTSNNVDINTENTTPYQVSYSVTNSAGKTMTATTKVLVVDDSVYGMLDVSISDFTIAQNGDYQAEIKKRIIVKNPDGTTTDPTEYTLYTSGSAGGGDVGTYNISVVVESLVYGTYTEKMVNITVMSGLTLNAVDSKIFLGDTFDPMANVSATENKADGSIVALGAYDGVSDTGISYSGLVDTTTAGVYPVTYSAKTASGVNQTKTVNVTVAASVITIEAADVTIMQGEAFNPLDYAKAMDERDGGLTVSVDSNNVDPAAIGTYSVTYSATNTAGTTETKTITVSVVERTAAITADNQEVYQGQEITDELILSWAQASDPVDTDLDLTYTILEGSIDTSIAGAVFTVEYAVTNTAGNTTTKSISITVLNREATIEAADQTVEVGTVISDADILNWAKASDPVDGENLAVTEFTVLDGPIDTTKEGTFTIQYSFTNTAGNTAVKTITLTVVDQLTPSIKVEDKVMYVGDKLTEEMILEWAEAENAEAIGFEVMGENIKVKASDSTLVETGVHEIKFFAEKGDKKAETVMTLTVKDREAAKPEGMGTTKQPAAKETVVKTEEIKSAEKELPETGMKESSLLTSISGLFMLAFAYFLKKKKDETTNDLY
ncbi:immunoglobulin-like domain-containing protein [Enterococcus sp. LJL51]|uniref:immunoglobulin-like domain-containing protein n=1 Tax=Enterococcus sp. LJL51 TaxID=3416656 RepID=UPI003CECBE44